MRTQHILLPTDFSSNARNAIDYAIYLFEKETCVFYVLSAYQMSASAVEDGKFNFQKKLEILVQQLKANKVNPKHSFKNILFEDSLLNAIGKTVIDNNISFVFMGTKGSSAVKEVFMGSSTVSVIKNIDFCRLVAVPKNYRFNIPDQIAFATNFEHVYSKVELSPLIDLAKLWDSEIVIVRIDTGGKLTSQQETCKHLLTERLDGLPLQFVEIKTESRISDAIKSFASENNKVGMIAMVNYWHSFFEKLTKENVINRIAFHTEVPFLVFPLIEP